MKKFLLYTWYAIKEIYYWFKLRKIIKKAKNSPKWQKHKLRVGWIYQIYTVINLKDEYVGEEEQAQKIQVMYQLEPITKYIASLDPLVKDITTLEVVKEPESKSYIAIYWPLFRYFSVWRTLKWLIIFGVIYYLLNVILTNLWHPYILPIIEFLKNLT